MHKIECWLFIPCLVVGILAGGCAQGEFQRPKNILLIGWDGAQRNHIKECLGRGELVNMRKLASEGNLVAIDILRVTDTKAGWAQILSGYEPEVTGVFSNSRYQPIPKGLSIFERLEKHFGPDNIITLAVIGKKKHVDADAPKKIRIETEVEGAQAKEAKAGKEKELGSAKKKEKKPKGKIIEEDGVKYRVVPGKPYYYTKDGMDLFENDLKLDEKVGRRAIELIEQHKDKRFFFFVHFPEVDHKGHKHGEDSKEYNDALISADTWTGRIIQKLKELNLYSRTLIYVTADHGFDEGTTRHKDAPYVSLATNDPMVIRRGERADIAPTILERFGLDLGKIEPPLDGHPLTRPYKEPLW